MIFTTLAHTHECVVRNIQGEFQKIGGESRGKVEGGRNPPLSSISLGFCLTLPKKLKKIVLFYEADSLPPFDCLSSYEKIMYISRLLCRVLLVRRSFWDQI